MVPKVLRLLLLLCFFLFIVAAVAAAVTVAFCLHTHYIALQTTFSQLISGRHFCLFSPKIPTDMHTMVMRVRAGACVCCERLTKNACMISDNSIRRNV